MATTSTNKDDWTLLLAKDAWGNIVPENGRIKTLMSTSKPSTDQFYGLPLDHLKDDSLTFTKAPNNIWGKCKGEDVTVTVNTSDEAQA